MRELSDRAFAVIAAATMILFVIPASAVGGTEPDQAERTDRGSVPANTAKQIPPIEDTDGDGSSCDELDTAFRQGKFAGQRGMITCVTLREPAVVTGIELPR